jgi:hypothetical protein
VRRRERGAVGAEQQPLQQRGRLGAGARGALARALLQDGVDLVPRLAVDDRVVLAGIAVALVDRLADVGAVVEHPVEVLLVDPVAARRADAARADLARQFRAGADLEEAGEDPAHMLGSPRRPPACGSRRRSRAAGCRPSTCPSSGWRATLSRMRSAVTSRSNWAKAEQDVQRQPPHGRGGVEGLRDRDEGHAVAVEHLDQLGEVHQRAAEAVDLVDHDHVDQPVLDVGQQPLQAGRSSVPPEMPPSSY